MHELGVLRHVVRMVSKVAKENQIENIEFISHCYSVLSGNWLLKEKTLWKKTDQNKRKY